MLDAELDRRKHERDERGLIAVARLRQFLQAGGAELATPSELVLAPWPSAAAAVALAEDAVAAALGISDEAEARRLGETAAALVERYAPLAPQPIKNEAVIRTCGWLHGQPAAAVRSEGIGEVSTAYATTHISALRHSGAMALLSPWKVRRAGAIG